MLYTIKIYPTKREREKREQPAVHVDKCSTTELYIIHLVNILFGVYVCDACDGPGHANEQKK